MNDDKTGIHSSPIARDGSVQSLGYASSNDVPIVGRTQLRNHPIGEARAIFTGEKVALNDGFEWLTKHGHLYGILSNAAVSIGGYNVIGCDGRSVRIL